MTAEKVVLVDLDSDSISDVNIEMPKNDAKKPRHSTRSKSAKNVEMRSYIYIDDDDECLDNARSSKKNLSRKRMYPPGKSDGFVMESDGGSSGTLQKLWEKASKKKKTNVEIVKSASVVEHKDDKSKATFSSNEIVLQDSIIETSIVNEKEKHEEEELLARERALKKVQAEEARLLKRQKAEKMRLLDTERRQKQRIAEIRESQKQDEKNMNLKEIYRVEVQKNLKKLEMTCHDMTSLLRGLGILADNDTYFPSHQVRAAYKRALLMFHPDRAQRCDMRQQVEAEEKFKLISRMKDQVMMLA